MATASLLYHFSMSDSDECKRDVDDDRRWEDDAEEEVDTNYRAYTPRLMDTQEMQTLRAALKRSEIQIQQQGHMQEYVPRKPVSSKLRRWYGLPRNQVSSVRRPVMSAGPLSRPQNSGLSSRRSPSQRPKTSTRPTPPGVKTAEFAKILKHEARQVRELERRYQDSKRSLLDYIDVVVSCKPNDRVGGQEVYEQLADLVSFASQCSISE